MAIRASEMQHRLDVPVGFQTGHMQSHKRSSVDDHFRRQHIAATDAAAIAAGPEERIHSDDTIVTADASIVMNIPALRLKLGENVPMIFRNWRADEDDVVWIRADHRRV
ncbi:hypothetical protein [Azospirillum sp. Sh1]|uniref:hypothetical protein n=1 Tax=Azospirillum sp. Sh1 TaxID=2607285 RepID=UPI0011EFB19B|nr:hypothetical protein [Azospirillum sp. Sh1]KAA0578212.1 hypothetical protein FZ029_10125 [Azospirillum sp. Sh1]